MKYIELRKQHQDKVDALPLKFAFSKEQFKSAMSELGLTESDTDKISWIGSFNLDPRSAYYNTENVAIFESPEFAAKLRDMIIDDTKTSWHVTLDDNDVQWRGQRHGDTEPQLYHHSPDTTIFRRIWKNICRLMPEKFV